MTHLADFGQRLLSRKFLLTVAAFATAVANKQYAAAVTAVLGYVGMEGYTDIRKFTG